jgi:hypothetical protein
MQRMGQRQHLGGIDLLHGVHHVQYLCQFFDVVVDLLITDLETGQIRYMLYVFIAQSHRQATIISASKGA